MPEFKSKISTSSADFSENRQGMLDLIEQLRDLNQRSSNASERSKARFEARNQLTPHKRLTHLLDPNMPFLPIGNLAGFTLDTKDRERSIPGGSVIGGIGYIEGTRCAVVVDDSGINAGAMTDGGSYRTTRLQSIALEKKMPFVHLVESAGANLMNYNVESFVRLGSLFANQARLSAAGVPVIAVLHGASTAGGAYMPGMSDYVIGIKGRGKAFLAGPALLKAATGEIAEEDELGGAEMHSTTSGLIEYLADNDTQGLLMCREAMRQLDWNKRLQPRALPEFEPPKYSSDEIAGVVPIDYRKPYDAREVIARIVDGSDLLEFKKDYGPATLCIQAKIFGHSCGIIANNGPIDPAGATKTTHFLQLCEQSNTPLIFLHNTTGYMVGKEYEHAGMIKHGSKMIQAVTNVKVPRIAMHIGASFGAGNYGMSGVGFNPDFSMTWPNAKTGVMGGQQAALTMTQVAESVAERKGQQVDREALEQQEQVLTKHFDSQSDAFYTSGHCLDDGVIDPRQSREVLATLLDICWCAQNREVTPNSFGIARM